jgi:Fe/S biogenesis protein NfuA
MAAWFGSKKEKETSNDENKSSSVEEENTASGNEEEQLITISDTARSKLAELIQGADSPIRGIRVLAEATSPANPQYSLAFVQEGEDFEDDTVIDFDDLKVFIDPDSLNYVQNVRLDFITSGMSGGFRIDRALPKAQLKGPVAEKVQQLIDDHINPALQEHGGYVQLIDVQETRVYIELGGGCKGCGMVDVTLKQGIERTLKQSIPEITEVLDTTDHASGNNPYYQPSK